jgi:hypothetical protein
MKPGTTNKSVVALVVVVVVLFIIIKFKAELYPRQKISVTECSETFTRSS